VATPIGNLDDVSARAIEVLSSVAGIAAEDTRRTRKLLARFSIGTPLLSYHEHNETTAARRIVDRINGGSDVALVSDAGTPLVSDPGYRLVSLCAREGIEVVAVPGPSAVAAALSVAGLPPHPFYFAGFLPRKQSARRRALESLADLPCTTVFYESPHRVAKSLLDMLEVLGDRPAARHCAATSPTSPPSSSSRSPQSLLYRRCFLKNLSIAGVVSLPFWPITPCPPSS